MVGVGLDAEGGRVLGVFGGDSGLSLGDFSDLDPLSMFIFLLIYADEEMVDVGAFSGEKDLGML